MTVDRVQLSLWQSGWINAMNKTVVDLEAPPKFVRVPRSRCCTLIKYSQYSEKSVVYDRFTSIPSVNSPVVLFDSMIGGSTGFDFFCTKQDS